MPVGVGILVAGLVLSALGVSLVDWSNRRKAQRLLAGRAALDEAAFGEVHFGESQERAALAGKVRRVLARHVPFGLEGLAPDDSLNEDLRIDHLDSMSNAEFVIDLEKTLGVTIVDSEVVGVSTFRQLLDYLEPRVAQSNKRAG